MKKVSEEVKKEIREYCRLHNTLTGVYRVLGEKYGVAWETVRRINEPKYDRLVHRMYMRRRLLKLFEQNKTGIKPTYHKIFLSRVRDSRTLEDVGKENKLTRERVRQIVAKVSYKLGYPQVELYS